LLSYRNRALTHSRNWMGKRKERRLAAQSNAGRRVKLDLFAEPSGIYIFMSFYDAIHLLDV